MKKLTNQWRRINRFNTLLLLLWTVVIAGFSIWDVQQKKQEIEVLALTEAKSGLNRDLALRRLISDIGGIYAPVGGIIKPNPHLANIPNRDIVTGSTTLTMVNPATVVRLMSELNKNDAQLHAVRITGLKYLNPANAPDAWEIAAMKSIEARGKQEFFEFVDINGQPHLRYMKPLIMEEPCLKCHAWTGIPVGKMRGATDIAVSMYEYQARSSASIRNMLVASGIIWLLGIALILFMMAKLRGGYLDRLAVHVRIEENLANTRLLLDSSLDAVIGMDQDGRVSAWNGRAEGIFGYSSEQAMGRHVVDLIVPPKYQEAHQQGLERFLKTGNSTIIGHPIEVSGLRADGTEFPVELTLSSIEYNGKISFSAYARDITERYLADRKLQNTITELNETQRIVHIGRWSLDTANGKLSWSDEVFKIFEVDPDKFDGTYDFFINAVHPEDRDTVNNTYQSHLGSKQ